MPANICPFVRQILSNIRSNSYSNLTVIVVSQSCNNMMHLYNALKESFDEFVYLLDIPHKQDQEAISFFVGELYSSLAFLESESKPLKNGALNKSIAKYNRRIDLIKKFMDNYSSTIDKIFLAEFMEYLRNHPLARLLLSGGIPPHSLVKCYPRNLT